MSQKKDPKEEIKKQVSKSLNQSLNHIKSELENLPEIKKQNFELSETLSSQIEKLIADYEKKELEKLENSKKELEKDLDSLDKNLTASSLEEILEKSQSAKKAISKPQDPYKLAFNMEILNRELKRCVTMSYRPINKKKEIESNVTTSHFVTPLNPVFNFMGVKQSKNFLVDLFNIRGAIQSGNFQQKMLKYIFNFYDTHKLGYIDEVEFEHLLMDMGNALFPEYVEALTKEIEKKNDVDFYMKKAIVRGMNLKFALESESLNEETIEESEKKSNKKITYDVFFRYFQRFFLHGLKKFTSESGIQSSLQEELSDIDFFNADQFGSQYLEMDLTDAVNNKICTASYTKTNFVKQKIYHCDDCELEVGLGICEVCVELCHKDHKTRLFDTGPYFCGCVRNYCDNYDSLMMLTIWINLLMTDANVTRMLTFKELTFPPRLNLSLKRENVLPSTLGKVTTLKNTSNALIVISLFAQVASVVLATQDTIFHSPVWMIVTVIVLIKIVKFVMKQTQNLHLPLLPPLCPMKSLPPPNHPWIPHV
jgi:hypothetical protein